MAAALHCYTFFHLNLFYSSIELARRSEVVTRCYRPLLGLASAGIPIGIEASGETLEAIATIDAAWLDGLGTEIEAGRVELIGSGYAQVVGPLVPSEVNRQNLALGIDVYEHLLGVRPTLALINEQAFSRSLADHYLDAGFRAVIMEWNNPKSAHPEWPAENRYRPGWICGASDRRLAVIWNDAIAFQKFQRYAHAETSLEQFLEDLETHIGKTDRGFPLYGNDAEIFDFRPGRYRTEPSPADGEWRRIAQLMDALQTIPGITLVPPSASLVLSGASDPIALETAAHPIPVKKQQKYNITRWAVTGRDDLGINTACYRCFDALSHRESDDKALWRQLVHLWGSDFRTHITDARWAAYLEALRLFEATLGLDAPAPIERVANDEGDAISLPGAVTVTRPTDRIRIETPSLLVTLNTRRGLAFDAVRFKRLSVMPLFGTLPHGFFDDIRMGADFYSGHLIYESPGMPKVTDLERVSPVIRSDGDGVAVTAVIDTPAGIIEKRIRIAAKTPVIELAFRLRWPTAPFGALRLGHLTLNPAAFDRQTLFYETHNGGAHPERFEVGDTVIDHGAPVSFLVSARQALGITEGVVRLGDGRHAVVLEIDKTTAALVGGVTFKDIGDRYFFRFSPSAAELDDTCRRETAHPAPYDRCFRFRLSARAS